MVYSRLFLGVHALDQVLYGSLLGLWIALSIHYLIRKDLVTHLQRVLSLQDKEYAANAAMALASLAVTMAVLLANYYLDEPHNEAIWKTRIGLKCGMEKI